MLYSQYNFVVANFDHKSTIIIIICYDIQHNVIKIRKLWRSNSEYFMQGPMITFVFQNPLRSFLYLYTWKVILGSWSADSNVNWQIWHRRELAKAGTRELCGFLSAHQPGFVSLLAPSSHATRRSRDQRGESAEENVRSSPSLHIWDHVISLIRPGQHQGGVRSRGSLSLSSDQRHEYLQIYSELWGKMSNRRQKPILIIVLLNELCFEWELAWYGVGCDEMWGSCVWSYLLLSLHV